MKKYTLLVLALGPALLFSQENDQRQAVIEVIETIFNGMRAGDSSAIRQVFTPEIRLQTTFTDKDGAPRIVEGSIDRRLQGVARPKEKIWDEKIWSYDVQMKGHTAWWDEKLDAWMGVCRGSGVLVKTDAGWKIRHYHLSVTVPKEKIEKFVDLVKD